MQRLTARCRRYYSTAAAPRPPPTCSAVRPAADGVLLRPARKLPSYRARCMRPMMPAMSMGWVPAMVVSYGYYRWLELHVFDRTARGPILVVVSSGLKV